MNVSSIVIRTTPQYLGEVIAEINAVNHCEVHFYDFEGKIVVTIEGESINDQIETMKHIQNSPHVLSANLMFSYCKDEITEALEKIGPG